MTRKKSAAPRNRDLEAKLRGNAKKAYSSHFVHEAQRNYADVLHVASIVRKDREAAKSRLLTGFAELYSNEVNTLRGIASAPKTVAEHLSEYPANRLTELVQR